MNNEEVYDFIKSKVENHGLIGSYEIVEVVDFLLDEIESLRNELNDVRNILNI